MSSGTGLAAPVLPPLTTPVAAEGDDEPRRLSWPRAVLALLLVAFLAAGAVLTAMRTIVSPAAVTRTTTWYAPYIDATVTPLFQFQNPYTNPARQTVLGFVVADKKDECEPSWGAAYTLDAASTELSMDRRVAQVQSNGGEVIVSFGGVANDDLATVCTDHSLLVSAYQKVISRYKVTTADFDVEGEALNPEATARRSKAIAELQRRVAATGGRLEVWLTLPVSRTGMLDNALESVRGAIAAGVKLAGVNVMSMDFGGPEPDMGQAVHTSLVGTHRQLMGILPHSGPEPDADETWRKIGVTVMLGQNDHAGEVYGLADAERLVQEAARWRLARVSIWSLNRDRRCSRSFSVVVHSNVCSGIDQETLAFSTIFSRLLGVVAAPTANASPSVSPVADNPATSPFPLWRPGRAYIAGYKVVRNGNVYQARWFTRGDDPAAPVGKRGQKAWTLLGPVLPGDKPNSPSPWPDGTYPRWTPRELYPLGSRVLFNRLPYQAKWQNRGVSPGDEENDPSISPWQPLFTVPGEPAES